MVISLISSFQYLVSCKQCPPIDLNRDVGIAFADETEVMGTYDMATIPGQVV